MRIEWYLHNLEINGSNNVALIYCRELSRRGLQLSVSALKSGPMEPWFRSAGARIELGQPSAERMCHHDMVIVNSLIRTDALPPACNSGRPFLIFIHEDWTEKDFKGCEQDGWRWTLPPWSAVEPLIKRASCLVFPARYLAEAYEHVNRCETIYNPIDANSLLGVRKTSATVDDNLDLICIGSINSRKNQSLLAQAAHEATCVKTCRFFGERSIRQHEIEYTTHLKQLCKTLTNCTFEFHPATFPLKMHIHPNTIFGITSLGEVLPCTVQEMMQLGVPILAPNRFGIPEVLTDKEDAALFDEYTTESVSTHIKSLMCPKRRRAYAGAAQSRASTLFNVKSSVNRLLSLLGEFGG
jgi:glycosyltransferase involved in cell wall biosynthesis